MEQCCALAFMRMTLAGAEKDTFQGGESSSSESVLSNGGRYDLWRVLDDSSIEIQATIDSHSFEVVTGYRAGKKRVAGADRQKSPPGRAAMAQSSGVASFRSLKMPACACCPG